MGTTYYIQPCPTCGRRLEVKVDYIGLEVSCYHCRARFIAEDSSLSARKNVVTFYPSSEYSNDMLDKFETQR